MDQTSSTRGAITLEACISVTAFMLIMLFMSNVFVMFRVQHETAHALLETSQSLSVDAYAAKKIGTGVNSETESLKDVSKSVYGLLSSKTYNQSFATNDQDWFIPKERDSSDPRHLVEAEAPTLVEGKHLEDTISQRFCGYLASDKSGADELLKELHVANGVDGLSFAGSHVSDGVLYIELRYEFEDGFMILGTPSPQIEQTAQSKLWQ